MNSKLFQVGDKVIVVGSLYSCVKTGTVTTITEITRNHFRPDGYKNSRPEYDLYVLGDLPCKLFCWHELKHYELDTRET